MSKEMDTAQILRHLEEDMGDLLGLFEIDDVFEVMLNPFKNEDGTYEGHLWYEQAGKGMVRLTNNQQIHLSRYPLPSIGDQIFIRYVYENNQRRILNHHVIPNSLLEIREAMGMLLKNTLRASEEGEVYLEQEEHYRLTLLADNISERGIYQHRKPIPDDDLTDCMKLVTEVNKKLAWLIGIEFRVDILTVDEVNISEFNIAPKYVIAKEFVKMSSSRAEQIMSILASATGVHFHAKEPRLECAIPFYHHRFTGQLPYMVKFPSFTIRKHSSRVIPLEEYVAIGQLPEHCAETIRDWIKRGYNILIGGGTGSGKTTLLNALLLEMARIHPEALNRVGIIEDTQEIQNPVDNAFEFTKTNEVTMDDCLRTALRMRPNSIVVGEVRGREAYTLFKAMLTGHKNCMGTIHANGAYETTFRYEQCIKEHPDCKDMPVQRDQICLALNGIISIQRTTVRVQRDGYWENVTKRKITALREITGYDPKHNVYEDIMYYQDKEAVMEFTKPVSNSFSKYQ